MAVIVVVAILAAAAVGLAWRRGDGTLRPGTGERIRPAEAALPDDAFGPVATLLFFTSQQEVRSPAVRALLDDVAAGMPGVRVAPVDLTTRGDLAGRFAVTATPTTFVLDSGGLLRFRIKGAARREDLLTALASVAPSG